MSPFLMAIIAMVVMGIGYAIVEDNGKKRGLTEKQIKRNQKLVLIVIMVVFAIIALFDGFAHPTKPSKWDQLTKEEQQEIEENMQVRDKVLDNYK